MKFDFELLKKNRFVKWGITAMAVQKFIVFTVLGIPAVWNEPVPLVTKLVGLSIGTFITFSLCYIACQFWKK